MAGEILILDAAASNPDGTDPGTALNIGPGTNYGLREFNAPTPPQSVLYAGTVDTEGSLPAARKHENRVISFKVLCSTAAALRTLQGKIGKVAREGGTLKWVLPNAETVIFDLHTADTFEPTIDKLHYVRAGAFCEVQITLVARPYGRGPSVSATLSAATATAKAPHVFTVTGVKGDMDALGQLQITNVTTDKTLLIWGLRSRYYDASAPLFYEAEGCGATLASPNAGFAGASGGGANKVMRHSNVGTSSSGALSFVLVGSLPYPTHIGTYRVIARVQASSTNTGIVRVRMNWNPSAVSDTITNSWVSIETAAGAAIQGSWVLVDLGLVTLQKTRFGVQAWTAGFSADSTVSTDDLDWDWLALIPADEGSGWLTSTVQPVTSTGAVAVAYETVKVRLNTGTNWYDGSYEGDHLRIPPAGAEGRTAEFIALLTGPTTSSGNLGNSGIDAVNIDATTATLTYTPRYLVVPEP